MAITNFLFSHSNLNIKQWLSSKEFFVSDEHRFCMTFLKSFLPPFCSTIRISLLSVGLEPWRRFRNSYCSQATWFGGIFLDRTVQIERCVAARCINVAVSTYSKKNISMHILDSIVWGGMPDNENQRKTIVNSWVRCLESNQLVITTGFPTVNFRKW